MAHIKGNQTERLVAINKLLPELESFLSDTLSKEPLSEPANVRREQLLSRLEGLTKPPQLPPRGGGGKKLSTSLIADNITGKNNDKKTSTVSELDSSRDYISEQREIARRQKNVDVVSTLPEMPAPYASKKRNLLSESDQHNGNKPSVSSISDDTGIYEKIPSESGSAKYIDILNYEMQNGPPPVPERTHRAQPLIPKASLGNGDAPANSRPKGILMHDLKNPSQAGPLKELRNNDKIWCVLKNKKLYIFRHLSHPASQIIDMLEYEIHIENMTNLNFRLSRPGFPSLLLASENEDEYKQWVYALEKCKYEELDDIMPEKFRNQNYDDDEDDDDDLENVKDHNYERPIELLAQVEKIKKDLPKPSLPVHDMTYVDMSGSQKDVGDDYVTQQLQSTSIDGLNDLSYDADLPPVPTSSDEEYTGDYTSKHKELLKNRHLPALPSEDQISGSFESLSSTSEDEETLKLTERKPRSSSGPPAYNVKSNDKLSLDRRISGSLSRQQEKSKFFSDPDAVHCGILHQRRILAVWQKRYCKVKTENLLCYRNQDSEEKPALQIHLPGYKIELCEKETWRNNSFKMSRANTETLYFAAETREQLMLWLNVIVKEIDKDKFGKDMLPSGSKTLLTPQPSGDTTSISSIERKFGEEGSTCDADSESAGSSENENDDNNERETQRKKSYRKHSLKKQSNIERFEDTNALMQGHLYVEASGEWQRLWCVIKESNFLSYKTSSHDFAKINVSLQTSRLILPSEDDAAKSDLYVMKLISDDGNVLMLASNKDLWKQWAESIKQQTESISEDNDVLLNLPKLPKSIKKLKNKGKQKTRNRNKKPAKNGTAVTDESVISANQLKEFSARLHLFTSHESKGEERWCHVKQGIFILSKDQLCLDSIIKIPIKELSLYEEGQIDNGAFSFNIQNSNGQRQFLSMGPKATYITLLETLWTQGADISGRDGSLAKNVAETITRAKRRSITFGDEPKIMEFGEITPNARTYFIPDLKDPNIRTMSDGENISRPRRLTKLKDKGQNGLAKTRSTTMTKSGGSRMSAFFRSLPKRNRKKYDFTLDTVDGLPKTQFSGTVKQVETNENGQEEIISRVCKVSGKIFYAYDMNNELKPIFKVPLRNAAIEENHEKENGQFTFTLSSMENHSSFKFQVENEEIFDKWSAVLYMIDTKSNTTGMSSRESLLDETKTDVDIDIKIDDDSRPFSGSNSSNSLSSMLSKQAKNLGGSNDELKTITTSERKISEDVFHGSLESVIHNGFLFEVNTTQINDIKSRVKTRRWCVLRKSWLEIYENDHDKVPVRGISLGHHKFDLNEDIGEKYAMCLRSEDDEFTLCASNDEDFNKWVYELRKVFKKQGRRTSDTAKQALRSARQLLSSSSLSGSGKRGSKRGTIVLNEVDEKVVEKFTDDVESGNKISGVLIIVMKDGKLTKPKKRLCKIRDGMFCIAKRSKPSKIIHQIDLSKVAILDECDLEKGLYRFRLDYDNNQSMSFQTIDHETADNWMVGISMAILLERLTSGEKFPQQEKIDYVDLEKDDKIEPETDDLGLINLSPVLTRVSQSSNSSNLSNDIKREIDRKISFGSNYLHPLSNLLESAFDGTPTPYSGSSAPSSREGTLERDYLKEIYTRKGSGEAIMEEAKEDEVDNSTQNGIQKFDELNGVSGQSTASNNSRESVAKEGIKSCETSAMKTVRSRESVSSTVAKFESMTSPRKESLEDNVFHTPLQEPDETQLEIQLSDLLKERESLEKERNVILDRLPHLKDVVKDAKERKNSENNSSEKTLLKKEFETANKDMNKMQTRLEVVNKRLKIVENLLQKKVPKISESFRTRTTVISPHIIV